MDSSSQALKTPLSEEISGIVPFDPESSLEKSFSPEGDYTPSVGPYVIAVSHQKGGVAKTTTAASLSAILAENGQNVLVIDLDPTANLTASFGITPSKVRRSTADILLGNEPLTNVRLHTGIRGLDVIPSNADMVTATRFLYLRPRYEHLLQSSLARDGGSYDFVILDCPPAVASLTTVALTAAQLVVIPIQCEYYSLQALEVMFKAINQVRTRTNPYLCFRMLVVMYDRRGNLHQRIYELVQNRYGKALFDTVIGFDSKLRESQLAGVPITLFAARSRSTEQYRVLAQELLAYVQR